MTQSKQQIDPIPLIKKNQKSLGETLDSLKKDAAEIVEQNSASTDKTDSERIDEYQQRPLSPLDNAKGKVGVPILLWFMGVPGFFVILIWFFFFRGE